MSDSSTSLLAAVREATERGSTNSASCRWSRTRSAAKPLPCSCHIDTACANTEELAAETSAHSDQHPAAEIITSLPGLGSLTSARVLAVIGDDRSRFADARVLKAYAGTALVTRASGKNLTVMHRRVKNQRLAGVGYVWAFSALTASPGARAHYERCRAAGDCHIAAQRNLFNRMIGILHHCLATRQTYDENTAFRHPVPTKHHDAHRGLTT